MDTVSEILLVLGSLLMLLAGVGAVRFDDVYTRMHAAAKAPALGILLIAVGVALSLRSASASAALALVVITQLVTGPVGAHMIARSVHLRLPFGIDVVDELADRDRPPGAEDDGPN